MKTGDSMGNIKTTFVKHIGKTLFETYPDRFSRDYSKNKEVVNDLVNIKSKKMKNVIAGYITNLKGQKKMM